MIFFDIDGTLLDYELAERNGILDFIRKHNPIFLVKNSKLANYGINSQNNTSINFLCNELSFQEQKKIKNDRSFSKSMAFS